MTLSTLLQDEKHNRARAIRRHADMVKCVEEAIEAFGQLRAQGIDLDALPLAMLDAKNALWKAHYYLMDNAPQVTAAEYLDFHGSDSSRA